MRFIGAAFVGLFLVGCGGRLEAVTGDAGSVATVDAPTGDHDSGTSSSTTIDGGCEPPAVGGSGGCVLCSGEYYCSDSRMPPSPPCPTGTNYGDACSSDCIMCSAPAAYGTTGPLSNTAWLLSCNDGAYQSVSFGNVCQ